MNILGGISYIFLKYLLGVLYMTMQVTVRHCLGDNLYHTAVEDGGEAPEAGLMGEHLLLQAGEWWPEPGYAYSCIPLKLRQNNNIASRNSYPSKRVWFFIYSQLKTTTATTKPRSQCSDIWKTESKFTCFGVCWWKGDAELSKYVFGELKNWFQWC